MEPAEDNGSLENLDLEQSRALNKIILTMLESKKKNDLFLKVILIISILANVAIAGIFVAYESQFTTTETITTTTVEQDTGEGSGNNVYQAGEDANYIQGDVGVITDGETDSYYGDSDTDTSVQQDEQQ